MDIEASAGRSKESLTRSCYRLTIKAENKAEARDLAALLHLLHKADIGLYECFDREIRAAEVERKQAATEPTP